MGESCTETLVPSKTTLNRPWAQGNPFKYPAQGVAQRKTCDNGKNSPSLGASNWGRLHGEEAYPSATSS